MVQVFSLSDRFSLGDLKVYLGRAACLGIESVRLVGGSGVLAVYASVLSAKGLLDDAPTVLGLRTFALTNSLVFDEIVPVRALLDHLSLLSITVTGKAGAIQVTLPPAENIAAWAGVSPPRGGWASAGTVAAEVLQKSAADGIAEVAAALPIGAGEHIVHQIRSRVWGQPIPGIECRIAAGAAFAAVSLGFIKPDEPVAVYESGPWIRLTTRRGHVLTR